MATMRVPSGAREVSIHAVVTRADGRVENLGTVSYWHKNPVKRIVVQASQAIKRMFARY